MMTRRLSGITVLLLGFVAVLAAGEGEDKSADRLKSAEKLVKAKDFDAALLILEAIPVESECRASALALKASALDQQGKSPEALEAYAASLESLKTRPPTAETRKIAEDCQKAILRLDKSRRLILKYADDLEREAKAFKEKDEYAYRKIMEVVEFMRGDGAANAKSSGGKGAESLIRARHAALMLAIAREDLGAALDLIDPLIRKAIGDETAKGFLRAMSALLKPAQLTEKEIDVKEVTLGESGIDARVVGRLRFGGQWKDSDPSYWILRDNAWYQGDEKQLAKFKPRKK